MKNQLSTSRRWLARAVAANFLIVGALTFGPTCVPQSKAQTDVQTLAPLPANSPHAGDINGFLAQDKKQMPPTDAVLFIGSSTIRMWDTLARDIPEIPVINRGFGGSQVHESTLYADRIAIPYKPKIIVIFAGTNDLASGKTPQQVFENFKAFADKIHAALPDTRIAYLSINPTVARWKQQAQVLEANYLIERWIFENGTKTRKLNFIDTHSQLQSAEGLPQPNLLRADGLHLNADGYKVYTSIVKPRVLALAAIDGVRRLDAPNAEPKAAQPKQ